MNGFDWWSAWIHITYWLRKLPEDAVHRRWLFSNEERYLAKRL